MSSGLTTLPVGEWRVELRGDTRDELFSRVATLIACAAGRTNGTHGTWEPVALSARDDAALLAGWANELIGRGEASGMAYAEVRNIELSPPGGRASPAWHLTAEIRGRPVDDWRSSLKAANGRRAGLERRGGQWHATLSFDI